MSSKIQTVTAFAESILFASDMETKLRAPAFDWIDDGPAHPPLIDPPAVPGRPSELAMNGSEKSKKSEFPTKSHLSNDRARGLVLHFFANHELLALELMALALLRWPDAPEGFRRGIIQTMTEEQTHMRLYLERMNSLGVSFGDAPLNSFFWKCLRDLSSPIEYVAAMSMTFEQANIDFAAYYENLFLREGDAETSAIMRRVRMDEIGHVKHGVIWFERWRPKHDRLFKEWQATLKFPLTPARAKGSRFDADGRRQAGLSEDFITELSVHNQSKGRPPRVFWFNPGCEQEVEAGTGVWTPPKAIIDLSADYAPLMALFAHHDDIVCVEERPTITHMKTLESMGLTLPEYLPKRNLDALHERKLQSFEPWGWSPAAQRFFAPFESRLVSSSLQPPIFSADPSTSIFSKNLAHELRHQLACNQIQTLKITSAAGMPMALESLTVLSPSRTVVFKAPFSASGRGMIRVRDAKPEIKDLNWIMNALNRHGTVIAEPWLEKLTDLSAHVDVSKDGSIKYIGATRFWTDVRGQYRGHLIGRMMDDLGSAVIQSWHHPGGWHESLKSLALEVGQKAHGRGYYGPLGIDAFIYRVDHQLHLRPLLELNPRWSMGRMAMVLQQRLAAKQCGIWIHISRQECLKSGLKTFGALVEALRQSHREDIRTHAHTRLIHRGVFPINDPSQARQSLALLVVGSSHQECYELLANQGLRDPQLEQQIYNHFRI
jgi:uncharacterized ferritin-like protein (DUF455 family)